jgi:hypothetical protein
MAAQNLRGRAEACEGGVCLVPIAGRNGLFDHRKQVVALPMVISQQFPDRFHKYLNTRHSIDERILQRLAANRIDQDQNDDKQ